MVELQNVSFRYTETVIQGGLSEINLTIPDGQVVLLCGKSGCGKTTLTRLVNGLIPNYYEGDLTGTVMIDGKGISQLPLYETAKYVGSVFQNPRSQFFTVDSTSELAFGCENQGLPEDEIVNRVKNVAAQFGMENLLGQNIFHLSGGEKQKIACASVAVSNPPVIVLDEPSSNLDVAATADLRHMIEIWKAQKKTVIIAEHRLYYLNGLLDRVLYMENGRIKYDWTADEAFSLAAEQQHELGLRPFDLLTFPVTIQPCAVCKELLCSKFHFSYIKDKDALHIESLSLPQGSITAIIGHNGAGKSTFARCLCGLEKRCKGLVQINERQYNKRKRLSLCYMVMQDVNHQLFTESTEEELLISMKDTDDDTARDVLRRLDLEQFRDRHPMALSGGEKQRVAIATALVSGREILIFDEPTSGLDLQHMHEVSKEILLLRELGKTSLVITHDYELIVSCCSHVLHLENGTAQEVYPLDAEGVKRLQTFFS